MELHVTPDEFSRLKDWSLLHESEFLGKVYSRWPWLRDNPIGATVQIIVDWRRPQPKRVFDNWPDGSIVTPRKNGDGTWRY